MKKLAVVALGGNALLRSHQAGTSEEQALNAYDTCKSLVEFLKHDYNIVITHGNGPQVGNILLQHDAGQKIHNVAQFPLDVCVAESEGSIGYWIEQQMRNVLTENNIDRNVITIVTQVLVSPDDKAFQHPTKPIGPYYKAEDAELLKQKNKWVFKEDPGQRGWRRVVASPQPMDILNKDIVKELAEEGNIIVAVGGGGIPVCRDEKGMLSGLEAVIDKDLASSLLANEIDADEFFILTDIDKVCINYKKENEKKLDKLTLSEAKEYFAKGEFAAGSMGPKVSAAMKFVENGGKEVTITEYKHLFAENGGTRIVQD